MENQYEDYEFRDIITNRQFVTVFRSFKADEKIKLLSALRKFLSTVQEKSSIFSEIMNSLTPNEKEDCFLTPISPYSEPILMYMLKEQHHRDAVLLHLLQDLTFSLSFENFSAKDQQQKSLMSLLMFSPDKLDDSTLDSLKKNTNYLTEAQIKLAVSLINSVILYALFTFCLTQASALIAVIAMFLISLCCIIQSKSMPVRQNVDVLCGLDYDCLPQILIRVFKIKEVDQPKIQSLLRETVPLSLIELTKPTADNKTKLALLLIELSHFMATINDADLSSSPLLLLQKELSLLLLENDSEKIKDVFLNSLVTAQTTLNSNQKSYLWELVSAIVFALCNLPTSVVYNLYQTRGQSCFFKTNTARLYEYIRELEQVGVGFSNGC